MGEASIPGPEGLGGGSRNSDYFGNPRKVQRMVGRQGAILEICQKFVGTSKGFVSRMKGGGRNREGAHPCANHYSIMEHRPNIAGREKEGTKEISPGLEGNKTNDPILGFGN